MRVSRAAPLWVAALAWFFWLWPVGNPRKPPELAGPVPTRPICVALLTLEHDGPVEVSQCFEDGDAREHLRAGPIGSDVVPWQRLVELYSDGVPVWFVAWTAKPLPEDRRPVAPRSNGGPYGE